MHIPLWLAMLIALAACSIREPQITDRTVTPLPSQVVISGESTARITTDGAQTPSTAMIKFFREGRSHHEHMATG